MGASKVFCFFFQVGVNKIQSSSHLELNRGSVYMGGGQCGGSPGLLGGTVRPPFLR